MKSQLVTSLAEYRREMENGGRVLVGVNKFATTRAVAVQAEGAKAIETIDPAVEKAAVSAIEEWRSHRDTVAVENSLAHLRETAKTTENLFEATVDCARAGVTNRRVVRRAARGVRRIPRADRGLGVRR